MNERFKVLHKSTMDALSQHITDAGGHWDETVAERIQFSCYSALQEFAGLPDSLSDIKAMLALFKKMSDKDQYIVASELDAVFSDPLRREIEQQKNDFRRMLDQVTGTAPDWERTEEQINAFKDIFEKDKRLKFKKYTGNELTPENRVVDVLERLLLKSPFKPWDWRGKRPPSKQKPCRQDLIYGLLCIYTDDCKLDAVQTEKRAGLRETFSDFLQTIITDLAMEAVFEKANLKKEIAEAQRFYKKIHNGRGNLSNE